MAERQRNNAPTAEIQHHSADNSSIIEYITKTIVELNTCRKIVLMYPPEHVQVQRSLKRACGILNQALSHQPELIIGIAKDTLLVGGTPLDPKNTICKEVAITLMQHEIAAITFYSDVTTEELLRFLLLIAQKPDDTHARGGILKASSECNLSKIQIQAIDYDKFQFSEEEEIADPPMNADCAADANIWQQYVVHLISGTLSDSENGKSLSEFGDVGPTQLAELLNQNQVDLKAALRTYRNVLKNEADKIRANRSVSVPIGQTVENPNPPEFSSTPVENLQHLNKLIRELNPDLRRQFMAETLQQCDTEDSTLR